MEQLALWIFFHIFSVAFLIYLFSKIDKEHITLTQKTENNMLALSTLGTVYPSSDPTKRKTSCILPLGG